MMVESKEKVARTDTTSKTESTTKTNTKSEKGQSDTKMESTSKTNTKIEKDQRNTKTESTSKLDTKIEKGQTNTKMESMSKTDSKIEKGQRYTKTESISKTDTRTEKGQTNTKMESTSKTDSKSEKGQTITKTESTSKTDSKSEKGKINTKIESTSKTDTKSEKGQTITKTESTSKTDTKTEKGQSNTNTESTSKTDTKTGKGQINTKTESTVKTDTKTEKGQTNTKTETIGKNDSKTETKGKTETYSKPETRNETSKTEDVQVTVRDETVRTSRPATSLCPEIHFPNVSYLLDRLNSDELTALRIHFYEKKVDEKIKEPKGSAHPRFRGFKLKRDEFIYAIGDVVGSQDYEETAGILFDQLVKHNAEEHKEFLWWEQILDRLIDFMSDKTKSRPGNLVKESFCSLYPMTHCKRETIVRVVPVETSTSFCFVVVSKYGKVGIYDWEMILLEQFEVRLSTQIATTAGGEVRRTTWVTDAVYMADAAFLLVAASDRSLHFYATSGLVCVPVYHISGLPNTPTCLHYTETTSPETPSMLLVGDDLGSIATMYFQQPQYALFRRTSNDALDRYFWKELSSQRAWVVITMDHGVHKDEITRVEYFSDNNTVVSCSNDPNTTVIIRYIVGRRAPYVFKVSRGVRCFHLDRSLRLLATGGKDCVVRLWNPIIPRKPVASLFGHKSCIVDVRILRYLSAILSMSKDTIVKVWDIEGQTCMQTLPLLFPVHGALARLAEFGVRSFYPGPVSCKQPVLTAKESTEIFFSPRTITTDSSAGSSSGYRVPSKSTVTLNEKSENSFHTMKSKSKSNLESTSNLVNSLSKSKSKLESTSNLVNSEYEKTTEGGVSVKVSTQRTMTQYTGTERSLESPSCVESPWTRMELLAVCCNYVVILQLSERDLGEGEDKRVGEWVNAPLRNQDPAAPSPWLTVDPELLTGLTDIYAPPRPEDEDAAVPGAVLATLRKSLGEDMTREFTAMVSSCYGRDSRQTDLKQIRAMVDRCAPHMALGTTEVEAVPTPPTVDNIRRSRRKEGTQEKEEVRTHRTSTVVDDSTISRSLKGTNTTATNSTRSTRSNI